MSERSKANLNHYLLLKKVVVFAACICSLSCQADGDAENPVNHDFRLERAHQRGRFEQNTRNDMRACMAGSCALASCALLYCASGALIAYFAYTHS